MARNRKKKGEERTKGETDWCTFEPVRGAPGHVTNPGHLKMHQPRASGMLRCTAL